MLLMKAPFPTGSRTICKTIPPIKMLKKRKGIAPKSGAPSPLDSTSALQQRLSSGRWTVSPEIRKRHHLEVSHRPGSPGFGHIKIGVVERDMFGMCLQKLIYFFSSFFSLSGIGKGGTNPWARNSFDVPSILFERSLNLRGFVSRRIFPMATGLCLLVWAHSRLFFGG